MNVKTGFLIIWTFLLLSFGYIGSSQKLTQLFPYNAAAFDGTNLGQALRSQAATATSFVYQGRLSDSDGAANGEYDFQFKLYDSSGGGNQIGSTVLKENVPVADGYFATELDFGDIFNGSPRWLEIGVRPGTSTAAFTTLSPRQALASTPYAIYSYNSSWNGLEGIPAGFSDNIDNVGVYTAGTGLTLSSTQFSISSSYRLPQGCSSGQVAKWSGGSGWICSNDETGSPGGSGDITAVIAGNGLSGGGSSGDVSLEVNFAGSGSSNYVARANHSHVGVNWSGDPLGAIPYILHLDGLGATAEGIHAEDFYTYAIYGEATSGSGIGVYGKATHSNGYNQGVKGLSTSTAGIGVYGEANAASGETAGVYGESWSTGGYGVWGYSPYIGVFGNTSSASGGSGVFGWAGYNNKNIGVTGSNSSDGIGVAGFQNNYSTTDKASYWTPAGLFGGQIGVMGISKAEGGYGVMGWNKASTGPGVYAVGSNRGIYAYATSATGYAGWFNGNVNVTGTLTKAGGSFKIDHPLDPENQYLYHSFVESPDMMNVYNGNVLLDENGEAWVELPEWFEALNRDFRYQLTPIGAPMPGLYIAEKVQENRFKIAGGEPGFEVSWLLTGIRQDPYAEANRIPVEEQKPPDEVGSYLYPQYYDQPAEMGLD